jgi:hypothetical protein
MPLRVTDLSLRAIPALKPIALVQFLNLSNLHPETPDLFPKDFEVIHTIRIADLDRLSVFCQSVREMWFRNPTL